ncbi:MAG: GAF domain-containing protein [Chloroflexi bacterium]|nr:GAF domain-containing protein [Chloroflexota bacterium]
MKAFTKLTLQKRINLLFLVGLVVSLGLFSWLGIQSVNESVNRTLQERLTIARVIANHLDENLRHVLLHLQNAANFDGRLPDKEQFSTEIASLRTIFGQSGIITLNAFLIDGDGRVLQIEPNMPSVIGTDMSGYPEVRKTVNTGLPIISGLMSTPLAEIPVVLMSAPIVDGDGQIIGALAVSIDVEQSNIGVFSQAVIVGKTGYTEIVDGNGIILARTRPASPPQYFERSDHPGKFTELINQGEATVGVCHRCHETPQSLERQRDVLAFAPLSTTSWGVAIRQSEEEALAPTRQLGQRLLFFGVILLVGASLLVGMVIQGIVKPIGTLTTATEKVAAGDFRAVIPIRRQDEIGQLSTAFYTMTQELAKSRNELVLRNEELSALNSIASTVSQSLNLEDVLQNAMRRVLEVTKTTAGCVFLRGADGNKLEMKTCIGLTRAFKCQETGFSLADCACRQVLRSGQTLMVNDVSQCPMLGEEAVIKEGIDYFVSVPLKSKAGTLGVMNIAGSNERPFTEDDFRLLDSIGYHVGLAIENSVLYEESKQKEKLRGQLLSSVINAQEEERKRIARELHDEHGQVLTGLIANIESLENMASPEQPKLKEKLMNARSLVVRALEDLRRLTLDLRPSALDDLGLITAIRAHTQRHLESVGIQVDFKTKGLNERLAPLVETALFRMIQEATNNIAKHAEAHNVRIQVEVKDNKVTVIIEDDGRGFDVAAAFRSRGVGRAQPLGLLGIQERATLLGGTFNIKSQVGRGTQLTVEIPIASSIGESSLVETK